VTRWQPVRAGIFNVWRYYDEVFTFENGRLLLRGPNGSGKSKALEVLLPFLLDANLLPSRLSTFGAASRSMHWNLMGEGASATTRVGYVWLELRLGDETRVTLGARLAATRLSTNVDVAYFLTDASVGEDLVLTDADRAPLTVSALRDAVGSRGSVFPKPAAPQYRTAVRERLYPGMSADRYDTLVQALLQLRRPKLSEHLDPDSVSTLLSSALPPVDEGLITELAEGFERLDQQRAHLAILHAQERAAAELATAARRHARVVLRERATALTQATTTLDTASAQLRHGETQLTQARAARTTERDEVVRTERLRQERTDVRNGLERSDAYQEGRNLDDLRKRATDARQTADRSLADERVAAGAATAADAAAAEQAAEARESQADLLERTVALERQSRALALETDLHRPDPFEDGAEATAVATGIDQWREAAATAVADLGSRTRSRRGQVAEVRGLAQAHAAAVDLRAAAEGRAAETAALHGAARERLARAEQQQRAAVDARIDAVRGWGGDLRALPVAVGVLRAALEGYDESCGEVDELADLVAHALGEVTTRTAVRRTELSAAAEAAARRRAAAAAERDELERNTAVAPERAPWRDTPAAEGAPLWRLVDVQDGVAPTDLAAVEAALESSGLLDAWVRPDGSFSISGHDAVLAASRDHPPHPADLRQLLRADSVDAGVPAAVVDAVLGSITLIGAAEAGPGTHAWVATDGRWRLGPLHGRWTKVEPQYLGATARDRHRRQEIARLTELLAELDADQAIEAERRALDGELAAARAEAERLPPATQVLAGDRAVQDARVHVTTRHDDHAAAVAERAEAERRVTARFAELEAAAGRAGLPTGTADLVALTSALEDAERAATALAGSLDPHVRVVRRAVRASEHARTARARHQDARDRVGSDEAKARGLESELAAFDATRGVEFREVVAQIKRIDAEIVGFTTALERHRTAAAEADRKVAAIEARLENAQERHQEAQASRDRAQDRLGEVLRSTLAEDAALDLDDGGDPDRVKAALGLARALLREVDGERATPLAVANALTERAHGVAAVLADRAQIELDSEALDVLVPTAVHGGGRSSVRELVQAIHDEYDQTRTEITEGEHQLFRRILTGDTRRHLSARIREAQDLVDGMNRRLTAVRTASDVQVRLRWEVRDDEGELLQLARRLLLTNAERLTEDDERALETFLDDRIGRARASDEAVPWAQQLARVFDYTAWHRFRVELSRNGGGWSPLTRRVHSALSGGEKAIALHLPLFAALAAHYEATPGAPRLILLDEVFVGIDTANRGQIFGLLHDLDLDLVLTSDHEWCAYPQVDGLAIHALAVGDGDDAVTSTRFVWTGEELVEDPLDSGMLL
jgi:uncharacterized protein (TIGR02680 family)